MRQYILLLFCLLLITSCKQEPKTKEAPQPIAQKSDPQAYFKDSVAFQPEKLPYKSLSEYGFFSGEIKALRPNPGVIPYDLITPLFTDYAHKKRFIWMPQGVQAKIGQEDRVLDFPKGSVIIKNFYYPEEDFREQRIMETRLLIHEEEGWQAYPYVWNTAQTEAQLKITGKVMPVTFTNPDGEKQSINYVVPNKNQCKNCHNRKDVLMPIGPKVMHLNRDLAFAEGSMNQLQKLDMVGYLANYNPQKTYTQVAQWDDETVDLNDRARSYLDINCAHCHNAEGSANTSGLFLDYLETDPARIGLCKSPVATGRGSGGHLYDIAPGNSAGSILSYRMASIQPDIMMPEIGRMSVHKEGVSLINAWIDTMEPNCD
jgi:uncharacterized repeat protein (TIGR03806 family)